MGIAIAVLSAATLAGSGAGAQGSASIPSYEVAIEVTPDGTMAVTETIDYDFGSSSGRHGIFREIPYRFAFDDRYDRLTPLSDIAVESPTGAPDQVSVTGAGSRRSIRIGDPDRTVSGRHTYVVSYTVRGALNVFSEHVELNWNAISPEWSVPISAARVKVAGPAGSISQVVCYAGPEGSRLACDSASVEVTEARFTHGALSPGEGLTVVVALAAGSVAAGDPILEERWSFGRAFSLTPATVGAAGLGTVAGVWAVVALLWHRGRDRRWVGSHVDVVFGNEDDVHEPVPLLHRPMDPVEYEPPDGIRAGQVGTLVDEVAHPLDVTATIVDLAVRGYLRIEEVEKEWFWSGSDWRLIRLRPPEGLMDYERSVMNGLFRSGDEVELSDLKRNFADRLGKIQSALYDDMVHQGWFARRPDRQRHLWQAVAVAALVASVAATVLLAANTRAGLIGLAPVIASLVLLAGAGKVPRRTPKGFAALRRTQGFRRFIEDSEAVRARFSEQERIFSEYLPYAIVFGVTDHWAKTFAGLDQAAAATVSGWYVGHGSFDLGGFGRSMESFSVNAAGSLSAAAASSGSSGFGGGGSSGGGFGGGGGGSW